MNASSSPTSKSPGRTTVDSWLKSATHQLMQAGIDTARLDCLVLLEDALNTNRTQLLAHGEQLLTDEQLGVLQQQLAWRQNHEPLAYIRGTAEFYGRPFAVNSAVLVPRPETETMIDLLLKLPQQPSLIVDVGTGSGALAISAALELNGNDPSRPPGKIRILATDVDPACLKVARQNAEKLNAKIQTQQADLLDGISLPSGAIVLANLPYVPDDYQLNQAAMHEPRQAIFGGSDGLDLYRRLFEQLSGHSVTILTEALPFQHVELAAIAGRHGFKQLAKEDFIQVFAKTQA